MHLHNMNTLSEGQIRVLDQIIVGAEKLNLCKPVIYAKNNKNVLLHD